MSAKILRFPVSNSSRPAPCAPNSTKLSRYLKELTLLDRSIQRAIATRRKVEREIIQLLKKWPQSELGWPPVRLEDQTRGGIKETRLIVGGPTVSKQDRRQQPARQARIPRRVSRSGS